MIESVPVAQEPVLKVRGLSVDYLSGNQPIRAVNSVNLDVSPGEVVGLIGESGSGKSTALLSLMGLLPESRVSVTTDELVLAGKDMSGAGGQRAIQEARGRDIGMVFQNPMTSFNPAFTIGYQIAEAMRKRLGMSKREAFSEVHRLLTEVGLPDPAEAAKKYPHQFSGGMRQRAMFALAISCGPKVLLADEPTTALDVTVQAKLLKLLRRICDEHQMGVILVTHNLGVAAALCDRVAVMYAGKVVEEGRLADVFRNPQAPYTAGLLRCIPRLGDVEMLSSGTIHPGILGSPPDIKALPPGCTFSPRCPHVRDTCRSKEPELGKRREPGHRARCFGSSTDGWIEVL